MSQRIKVAVTGAGGQIGYAFLFRLASGEVFGPDITVDLSLLEIEAALPALEGLVMELQDCAFKTLGNVTINSDPNKAFAGINWAVLIGSIPRKAGMERKDLLGINGKIFKPQGEAINNHASDDVKVFVVGNPCNTNCLIAMNHAPDVPRDRFFAMTMLDECRAISQLAMKAGATVKDVKKVAIWGNHSSTQFPDFYHATINGKLVPEVIHDEKWLKDDFIPMIQQRGAAVIKARGASSAASAANGVIKSLQALTRETPKDDWFSVAQYSTGEYGVDKGLIFSFPTQIENGKLKVVTGLTHNEFAKQKIELTLNELREEYAAVKELGLVD